MGYDDVECDKCKVVKECKCYLRGNYISGIRFICKDCENKYGIESLYSLSTVNKNHSQEQKGVKSAVSFKEAKAIVPDTSKSKEKKQ